MRRSDRRSLPAALWIAALVLLSPGSATAEEWYEAYRDGLNALSRGDAARAITHFERAVSKRPDPGENILTYGTNVLKRYYPYLDLADAQITAGRLDAAAATLQRSESVDREPVAQRERLQGRLAAARAASATPPPTPVPTAIEPTPRPSPPAISTPTATTIPPSAPEPTPTLDTSPSPAPTPPLAVGPTPTPRPAPALVAPSVSPERTPAPPDAGSEGEGPGCGSACRGADGSSRGVLVTAWRSRVHRRCPDRDDRSDLRPTRGSGDRSRSAHGADGRGRPRRRFGDSGHRGGGVVRASTAASLQGRVELGHRSRLWGDLSGRRGAR